MSTSVAGVVVEKPWYLSKKIWLCVNALGLARAQELTGRWTSVTPDQLVARIAETATWLAPLLGTTLSLARVEGKTRAAALLSDAIKTTETLDQTNSST